jgi:membrane-bound lytic murein transglycosylase B
MAAKVIEVKWETIMTGGVIFLLLLLTGLAVLAVKMPGTKIVYVPTTGPVTVNVEAVRIVSTEPGEKAEAGSMDEIFELVEKETGVHQQVLDSIWLIETCRGGFLGEYDPDEDEVMPTKRRQAFEKICDEVGLKPESLHCSSKGAIGHMQLMPEMWLVYGRGPDGTLGNPWLLPDAARAAARFLIDHGYPKTIWGAVCQYGGGNNRGWSVQHYANVVLRRAAAWGAPIEL